MDIFLYHEHCYIYKLYQMFTYSLYIFADTLEMIKMCQTLMQKLMIVAGVLFILKAFSKITISFVKDIWNGNLFHHSNSVEKNVINKDAGDEASRWKMIPETSSDIQMNDCTFLLMLNVLWN